MAKFILVGAGLIGSQIKKTVEAQGHEVVATVNSKSIRRSDGVVVPITNVGDPDEMRTHLKTLCRDVDVAFLAIPTRANAESEMMYFRIFFELGIYVVTAAKGAIAWRYDELKDHINKVGFSAVVGGGTRLLPWLRNRNLAGKPLVMYGVVNASVGYIMTGVRLGRSLEEMVEEAAEKGFLEPGAKNPLPVFNSEREDIKAKLSAAHNLALAGENGPFLKPSMFTAADLKEKDLTEIALPTKKLGYLVRYATVDADFECAPDSPGYLEAAVNGCRVHGGFWPLDSSEVGKWFPANADNGFYIKEGVDGKFYNYTSPSGPGAGAVVTAQASVNDALNHLRAQQN